MLEQYKPALKQGVTMTVVGLLIFFVTYAIDPLFLAKPKGWMVLIVVNMLALPIYFLIMGLTTAFIYQNTFLFLIFMLTVFKLTNHSKDKFLSSS